MLIVKLGGSVVQKSLTEMNHDIIQLMEILLDTGESFLITTGGGKIARLFLQPLKLLGIPDEGLHEVGCKAVDFQAEYVRQMLPESSRYPTVLNSIELLKDAVGKRNIYKYFSAGSVLRGASSDYMPALAAKHFKVKKILRITDIDYIYDSDPRKNSSAKSLSEVTWDEYLSIIGNPEVFEPGGSYPIDPISARFCRENALETQLTSLENLLKQGNIDYFNGTLVKG